MPQALMQHDNDPKQTLLDKIGDHSGFNLFNMQVLVAIYIRPEKTVKGIYLPETHRDEDRFQSKVGLVLDMGPIAFTNDTNGWFTEVDVKVGDWAVFRPSDGWSITINGHQCRVLNDVNVRGTVNHPDLVW